MADNQLAIIYSQNRIALSTLGSNVLLGAVDSKLDAAQLNGFRVTRAEVMIEVAGKTGAEGALMVGAAMNQTDAEIEAALEADPQSAVDPDGEPTKRPVWPLGMIGTGDTNVVLNNGVPIIWTPKWSKPEGQDLRWWIYNDGAGALTTGAIASFLVKYFGVWLRD